MGSVKAKWEKQTRIQSHMHPDPINKPTHHEEQPQPEEVAIIGKPPQVDVQIRCIVKVLLPVQSLLFLLGVHRTEQNAIPFHRGTNQNAHETSVLEGAHRVHETRRSPVVLPREHREQPIALILTSPNHPHNWSQRGRQGHVLLRALVLPPALHVHLNEL